MTTGNSAASRDIAHRLHPFTNLSRHESQGPLIITEGKGVFVTDDAGKTYLDAMAGTWCTALGWGEERLAEAAARPRRRRVASTLDRGGRWIAHPLIARRRRWRQGTSRRRR